MRYFGLSFCFLALLILVTGCDEFFEENIEKDRISILAPADGTETEIVTQTFWWERMKGATGYRLQIFSPSFGAIEVLLADTLIKGDKFETTLYPGDFEWRIRGENSAYFSEWSVAKLSIFDSDDLTRQTLRLRTPAKNAFLNISETVFSWDRLNNANHYELKVYRNGWGQNLLMEQSGLTTNQFEISLDEGELWWGVRAVNSISQSLFSNQRLVIDRTPPVVPSLILPVNNAALSDSTVVFKWNSSDPPWNLVVDSLFIFEKINSQGNKLYHKAAYTNKTATVKLYRGKSYLWQVKSKDQAGNESGLSNSLNISVN